MPSQKNNFTQEDLPLNLKKPMTMHTPPYILIPTAIPVEPFREILPDCQLIYPTNEAFTDQEVLQHLPQCTAMVSIFGRKITAGMIDVAPQLKIIANYGAGYDNVDVQHARDKGIIVTNCPHPVTEPTAELALALMLNVARRVSHLDAALKHGKPLRWGTIQNLSNTLWGKRLGIVGMGAIGKAVARRALAFGMTVVYHNRKPMSPADEKQYHATWLPLHELLSSADIVSLHVPLTSDTRHLMNRITFEQMKPTAILINTARGAVIDETALIEALSNGTIAGAGLDVYEDEPQIPPALLKLDNVVLTPHTGSATIETRIEMSQVVAQNIRAFIDGMTPPNMVS